MNEHIKYQKILEEDRMELLMRYPFYGRVVCKCELRVSSQMTPVSGNDCKRIFLSESKYFALDPESRIQILSHEVLHIALRHAFRCGNRDQERFSFASDTEIYFLLKDQFNLPDEPAYDEEWKDLTAEEIYEILPSVLPEKPQQHFYPDPGMDLPSNNQEDKNQSGVLPATEESNRNGDGLVNDSSNDESDSDNLKSFDDGSQPVIPEFEKDSELFFPSSFS